MLGFRSSGLGKLSSPLALPGIGLHLPCVAEVPGAACSQVCEPVAVIGSKSGTVFETVAI